MRHRIPRLLLTLAVLSGLTLAGPLPSLWSANLSTDYTGIPSYTSDVVTPNVLMLMDNSISMQERANCDPHDCVPLPDGSSVDNGDPVSVAAQRFKYNISYSGYFDSKRCYTYHDGTWNNNTADVDNRFADVAAKTPAGVVTGLCLDDQWDGNLLNWITFRRIDALKNAMIGGECAVSRNPADGTCTPIGTPLKPTIKSHRSANLAPFILKLDPSNPNQIVGRVPAAYRYSAQPGFLTILLRGTGSYVGWFCVNKNFLNLFPAEPCDTGMQPGATVTLHFHQNLIDYWDPAYDINHPLVHHNAVHTAAYDTWSITSYIEGIPQWSVFHHPAVDIAAYDDPAWIEHVPAYHHYQPYLDYDYLYTYPSTRVAGYNSYAAGFNIRLASDTQRTGVLQQIGSKARFGLMIFHPDTTPINKDGGKVLVGIGARQTLNFTVSPNTVQTVATNNIAMINGIELTRPATPTPLAEALYSAARYIAQLPSTFDTTVYTYPLAFGTGGLGSGIGAIGPSEITALISPQTCPSGYITNACGRDPYFFGQNHTPAWASPSAVVPCCKTFVIIVTDGAPTLDANIPVGLQEYAHTRLPSITQCIGVACASNPTTPPSTLLQQHRTNYPGGSHYLDDVALWAHTADLRQALVPIGDGPSEPGHDLPGMQNITLYTVYAFGSISGREILMQAARQGGFVDDVPYNGLPDLTGQPCTNANGTTGVSSQEWDKINNITGLLGPDCIPDNYFESSNADAIRDRLFLTITQILEANTSGAAVSVLASSSTGEGISYQAFFYQTKTELNALSVPKQLTWLGYLQGFFVDSFGNLREDTVGDGKLKLKEDHIIKLRFDPAPTTGSPRTVADIWKDTNGTGVGDVQLGTTELWQLKPVWEGGRRLALTNPSNRTILTWIDLNNNGLVDPGEQIPFTTASMDAMCPYLDGTNVSTCVSGGPQGPGQAEAANIINFIRGVQDPAVGFRNRERQVTDDLGVTGPNVWKLGDIMSSTPVLVGTPHERYDVIYGDVGYSQFFQLYKDRRQVVYAGANDGMLHAFNGGFLSNGVASADEHIRFAEIPMQPGSNFSCGSTLPCGAVTGPTYPLRAGTPPKLGDELWAFVPQDLLPQLRWLTDPSYSHIYYVDLKPKASDVRIFCDTTNATSAPNCIDGQTTSHPGGWGTILIGGFRFGGSCSNCIQGKGDARTVTADFGGGPSTRVFLSSYFVLDVTNPEQDPVLLWTFRDQDLGLTTAAPSIVRVNTVAGTSDPNEKWYAVFGTGMTHYDGSSGQTAQIFAVDLLGPSYGAVNQTSGTVRGKTCTVASPCLAANTTVGAAVGRFSTAKTGFMGDAAPLDADLDFRVDAIYVGSVLCNGATPSPCNGSSPVWKGIMWRLTTNGGSPDLATWGVSGAPKSLISTFSCVDTTPTCSQNVGPIVAAPSLSIDEAHNFWVFFGTGRLITALDKGNTDTQNYFGVKDCIISSLCFDQTVERHDLLDVSNVSICTSCNSTMNVSTDGGATFTQGFATDIVSGLQSRDGWVTTLTVGERSLSSAALLGGTLFFTTFIPDASICEFSGNGRLYGLYYLTGTGYTGSSVGTSTVAGNKMVNTFIAVDPGMPSQVALHIGTQGAGAPGESVTTGCTSRVTANIGTSTAAISQPCVQPALIPWSHFISWRDL
jgi:type IV pilus assembly protein PilY1